MAAQIGATLSSKAPGGVGMSAHGPSETDSYLAAVAAHGLPHSAFRAPRDPLTGDRWGHFLESSIHHRVIGHVVRGIADGACPADAYQAAHASAVLERILARVLMLEHQLIRHAQMFRRAGIDYRLLKGSAVAHRDYPDPSLRTYVDIDLLVRPEAIDDAVGLLVELDGQRRWPEPFPGFDRRFGKGAVFLMPGGYELDLHRSLAQGPLGLMLELDPLFEDVEYVVIAGHRLDVMGTDQRLLHACYHAAVGTVPPRLGQLRDVAQILVSGRSDTARVLELAGRSGALAVVARAVDLTAAALQLGSQVPLVTWARSYRYSRQDRRVLSTYLAIEPTFAARAFASLRVLPTWSDRAAFLRGIVLPGQEFLGSRDHARVAEHWRRAGRRLLRRSSRS